MKNIVLSPEKFIPSQSGANITFHRIAWDSSRQPESIIAGSDLRYYSIASDNTALHSHEFAEFFIVISGKVRHIVNGETQDLQAGMLTFIRPNDVHSFEKLNDSVCEMVNVAFKLELLLDLSTYLGNDFFLRRYTGPVLPPTFTLSLVETEELALRLIRLITLQKTDLDQARLKLKMILAEIFTRFFLEWQTPDPSRPQWFDKLCSEMKRKENLIGGLKTMLKLAPCTQQHLCKCFRQYLNTSPTEFINEQRIKLAAKQIIETDEKILAIALEYGFKSLSRFYKIFHKYYGVSPARLRQISRQKVIPL